MRHYTILYFTTLLIMATLDICWLQGIAKDFYETRIGDMLEFHALPAIVFYVIYIAGIIVFVSGDKRATAWKPVAVYGAMFGFVAYATYELTNLATLHGWSNSVAIVDMAWGTFNTSFSAACGWLIAGHFRRSLKRGEQNPY